MVFRPEIVRERLKRLEEVLARLRGYRGLSAEVYAGDVERQWIVERGFILAAECVGDIAIHVLSGRFSMQPSDHEDAVQRLGAEDVISAALTSRLRGFGELRDILVHEHVRIDPKRVYEYLQTELDALDEFVAQVSAWVDRETPSGPPPGG